MIVVADSSPLIVLVRISQVYILPSLFQRVLIPPAVASELSQANRPEAIKHFIQSPPPWLLLKAPEAMEPIPLLHQGECEAIALALQLKADLLLIDDAAGRKAATERLLPIAGTIGILERAAGQGLLALEDAFE